MVQLEVCHCERSAWLAGAAAPRPCNARLPAHTWGRREPMCGSTSLVQGPSALPAGGSGSGGGGSSGRGSFSAKVASAAVCCWRLCAAGVGQFHSHCTPTCGHDEGHSRLGCRQQGAAHAGRQLLLRVEQRAIHVADDQLHLAAPAGKVFCCWGGGGATRGSGWRQRLPAASGGGLQQQ